MNQPHRIGIINYSHSDWQGGRNYIQNLLTALQTLDADSLNFEVVEVPSHESKSNSVLTRLKNRFHTIRGIHQPQLHAELVKQGIDFAYYCATGDREKVGYQSAHWIADFQSLVRPEFSPDDYSVKAQSYFRSVLRDSQQVVLSSNASQNDCRKLFPEYVSKTAVLPFRVATFPQLIEQSLPSLPELKKRFDLPDKFFIVCNQFWAHKNHETIFKAVEMLSKKNKSTCVVCTGQWKDLRNRNHQETIDRLLEKPSIKQGIRLVGKIPFDSLLGLIRHSHAVIQPSHFEGWNTSVEESHCLGKTILLSDIPVHREQACPTAQYFDPTSYESLAKLMCNSLDEATTGFDAGREQMAVDRYTVKIKEFARAFLNLATQSQHNHYG
ncbi:glycosyltransferase family 4 protein [Rhodopirellula baltica]|nr:glycosyltransferase family 1 protein [Rhodopirellula baltica]